MPALKAALACCVAIVVAGCYTPAELMTEGKRFDLVSAQPPEKVAECIASNMEDFPGSALMARVRNTTPIQVAVRGSDNVGYAMIEIAAGNPGSIITFYIHPGATPDKVDRYTSGCL